MLQTDIGKTGIVGLLPGERPGPVVMLRFDMDALPITEENTTEYTSETPARCTPAVTTAMWQSGWVWRGCWCIIGTSWRVQSSSSFNRPKKAWAAQRK